MALHPCPECHVPISEHAETCPQCGFPVAEAEALGLAPKASGASDGLGSFLLLGVLVLLGYGLWTSAQSGDNQSANASPSLQAAAQGEKLHWDLLETVNADPVYRRGALVGAWTQRPRASITVPMKAWDVLSEKARESLMQHAATLVPVMSSDPFPYVEGLAESGGARGLEESSRRMQPGDWCIYVGSPIPAQGGGPVRLLRGAEVASGNRAPHQR